MQKHHAHAHSPPRPYVRAHALARIHSHIGRFRFLTAVLVFMISFRPFLDGFLALGLLTDILFAFVFFSGVYAVKGEGSPYWLGWVLSLGYAGLSISDKLGWLEVVEPFEKALVTLFLLLTLHSIYLQIKAEERVTLDLIFAAACSFLLVGLIWAHAYYFVELAYPGSFKGIEQVGEDTSDFAYFSFVTLTTAGFGDIVPATKQARGLVILEAVTGQLYLVVLMGRLVSAYVSQPWESGK